MAKTTTAASEAIASRPKAARSSLLRWHPARLLYLFVVTLVVGILYSEAQAVITDPSSALDPLQLQNTFFWHLALTYPIYFAVASLLAIGAAIVGWRVERRYAAAQEEQRHQESVRVAEEVVQRAQEGGQIGSKTIPRDLPPRAPGFVGRQQDLDQIETSLRQSQAVAIVGMGGLGKSSLAAEAVHALASDAAAFPGGITWVRCDERTGLEGLTWIEDQLLAAWGASLPSESGTRADPEEVLVLREQALRRRLNVEGSPQPALVFLDNVEPGLPLTRLIETVEPLRMTALLTSRVEPSSQRVRLLRLDVLDADAAVRLFAERYAARGGVWDVQRDAPSATGIVDALGDLPLAIELAAARAARARLPLATLAEELRAPDAIARLSDPVDPSSSVRYSLRKTLLALTPSQRVRFAALGLPEGADWAQPIIERMFEGVPLLSTQADDAAPAPTSSLSAPGRSATARTDLEALVAYSLVGISPNALTGVPRVRLHPLLRELARENWARQDAVMRRAALGGLLAGVNAWVSQSRSDRDLAVLSLDEDLIVAALRQAFDERVDLPATLSAASAFQRYVHLFNHFGLQDELAHRQREGARAIGDHSAELLALRSLANAAEWTGRDADATRYRQEALPLARELGDQATVVEYTAALGASAAASGSLDEAQRLYDEARAAMSALGEQPLDGRMLNILGILAARLNHPEDARPLLDRAIARARATGDIEIETLAMYNLAGVFDTLGDYPEARRLYEQSVITLHDRVVDVSNPETDTADAYVYDRYGELALKTGDLQTAAREFQRALHLFERGDVDPIMVIHLRGNLAAVAGATARERGDMNEALRRYHEALTLYDQEGTYPFNHMTRDYVAFVEQQLAAFSAEQLPGDAPAARSHKSGGSR